MAKINLDKLSLDELKALKNDVAKTIAQFEKKQRDEALAAAEKAAKEFGFSLKDLTGSKRAGKAPAAPKYQHPENSALTWSGRGRQPTWYKEALQSGKTPADMEIG